MRQEVLGELLGRGSTVAATTIEAAILGGSRAGGVGAAFAAGYQAALRALVPDLPADRVVCLCATEEGGAHPRAIATRLSPDPAGGYRISGHKKWVTGGTLADELLVVASLGVDAGGRNQLRLVRMDAHGEGVVLEPMPPAPFVPEIPHAEVEFADAPVQAVLPGDGYERYLKPFRTIEDTHVHAAVLAYVLAVARQAGWPEDAQEELVAVLAAAHAVAGCEASAPETHLLLAGVLSLSRRALERARPHWALVDEDTRRRWERDAVLLDVAGKARALRTEAAWKTLRSR